jgi:hypothetical protein
MRELNSFGMHPVTTRSGRAMPHGANTRRRNRARESGQRSRERMNNCAADHECVGSNRICVGGNPIKKVHRLPTMSDEIGIRGHGRVRGLTPRDVDAVSEALAGRRRSISVTPKLVLFYFCDYELAVVVRLNPKQ